MNTNEIKYYKNDKYITGPINAIRIENKDKVIYLFSDLHMELNKQTECEDIKSVQFYQYLDKKFRKTEQILDFFYEEPTGIYYNFEKFKKNKEESKKDKNEPISIYFQTIEKIIDKKYENVRKHFINIRSEENLFDIYYNLSDGITNIINLDTDKTFLSEKYINELLKTFDNFLLILTFIDNIINKKNEDNELKEKYKSFVKFIDRIKKFTDKSENAEKFEIIFKNMNLWYNTMITTINEIKELIKKLYEENNKKTTIILNNKGEYHRGNIDKIDELKSNLNKKLNEIYNNLFFYDVYLMDLYFLRRILEKKYIKTGIVYAGNLHITNYLIFLVKYYDFKITNIVYNMFGSIDKLNNYIRKQDIGFSHTFLMQPIFHQCINLKHFPVVFI